MSKKLFAVLGTVGAGTLAFAGSTFAAVDATVASTTETLVDTMSENIMGVIDSNIGTMILAGVLILSILVIWRLGKRFVSGR